MNYTDEDKAVRNFIIIFIIVLLIAIGMYFFTKLVVNKDAESASTDETSEVEIDNSKAIVGTMLNKNERNYYVILYKSDADKVGEYLSLASEYEAKPDSLALYTVDLSNALNSKFYDPDNENLKSDDVNELRFGDITVLEIKDSKIVNSYNSINKIKKAWKLS